MANDDDVDLGGYQELDAALVGSLAHEHSLVESHQGIELGVRQLGLENAGPTLAEWRGMLAAALTATGGAAVVPPLERRDVDEALSDGPDSPGPGPTGWWSPVDAPTESSWVRGRAAAGAPETPAGWFSRIQEALLLGSEPTPASYATAIRTDRLGWPSRGARVLVATSRRDRGHLGWAVRIGARDNELVVRLGLLPPGRHLPVMSRWDLDDGERRSLMAAVRERTLGFASHLQSTGLDRVRSDLPSGFDAQPSDGLLSVPRWVGGHGPVRWTDDPALTTWLVRTRVDYRWGYLGDNLDVPLVATRGGAMGLPVTITVLLHRSLGDGCGYAIAPDVALVAGGTATAPEEVDRMGSYRASRSIRGPAIEA